MKQQYKIIGVNEEFDRVRISIQSVEIVKEKDTQESILLNPFGFVEKMKKEAIQHNRPEAITIPKEEWKKYKWNINDFIFIEVSND